MSNVLGIPIPEDFKDAIGMAADNLASSWETRIGQVATEQLTEDMLMLALTGNLFTIDQWWIDNEEDIKDRWNRAFVPILIMLAMAQGAALCASLGITITLSYIYTDAWATGMISEMNDFIYATTADNLRVLIEQANDEGWDLRTLRDRILLIYEQWINGNLDVEEDFGWFNRRAPVQRTTLISETESILTVGMAALALYLALGIELTQWWSIPDERRCPWCGELHGTIISTGEPWLSAGDVLDVSGAALIISRTVLSPPLHCSCRCFIAPYFG